MEASLLKHLGELGSFGLFALVVLFIVFKYGLPAMRSKTDKPHTTNPFGINLNGSASRLFEKLDNIEDKTDKLHDMHDAKTADGIYKWWLPHDLPLKMNDLTSATQKLIDVSTKTLESQNRIAANQEEIIVEFRRNNDLQEAKVEFYKSQVQ